MSEEEEEFQDQVQVDEENLNNKLEEQQLQEEEIQKSQNRDQEMQESVQSIKQTQKNGISSKQIVQSEEIQVIRKQLLIKQKERLLWKSYDFLFPGGRVAKLIKITDNNSKNIPFNDFLYKLKLEDGGPVLNLIGAKDTSRGKFYGGVARACYNTDAIIIDNAISSGIEKYVIRRGLKLIGVAPENEVKYPKINTNYIDPYEISNGHTHIFLINNNEKNAFWGTEANFKINLCRKLIDGKQRQKENNKIVHLLLGESDSFMSELQLAVLYQQPVLIVKGSQLCNEFFQNQNKQNAIYSDPLFGQLIKKGKFFGLNSTDSEDVAQALHFFLTVTPY